MTNCKGASRWKEQVLVDQRGQKTVCANGYEEGVSSRHEVKVNLQYRGRRGSHKHKMLGSGGQSTC